MAFKAITKGAWGAETRKETVRVGTSNEQLAVMIPRELVRQIGSPRYVEAMIGTGVDAGWLRLQAAATKTGNYTISNNGKGGASLRVGIPARQVGASNVKLSSTDVSHTVERDAICVYVGPAIAAARSYAVAAE
jgi:hypothetical protein